MLELMKESAGGEGSQTAWPARPQVLIPAAPWHSLLLDGEELFADEGQAERVVQQ